MPDGGGSGSLDATDLDNPDILNFQEREDEEAERLAGEAGGAEEPQDGSPGEDEAVGSLDEEALREAVLDELLVSVAGEEVPLGELKLGYLRDHDYRMKSHEVEMRARGLEEMSSRVANTADILAELLAASLPPAPSPQLASTDPQSYAQLKAQYDAGVQQIEQLMALGALPRDVKDHLSDEQMQAKLADEDAKLRSVFPQTSEPEGREAFFQAAFDTGRHLGFTDEEMRDFTDHRYLKVIHFARLGLQAEQARAAAMRKVNNAPPPVPRGKAANRNTENRRSREAMARLTQSGSLRDALEIDF
ncbi:hypothetical protein [Oryzifoliimicrobium ureilyticus]|uniref:hypothetical protein n=1 Tax=Oryzifoliimicrobium ureilyticus TaxID=3113724 RepID=UPI0030766E10